MTTHPPCVICGVDIRRERGEREELWLSRKACGLRCRDALRSRTQIAKAAARLVEAVRTWQPGAATGTHAQAHGLKHAVLRAALTDAGVRLAAGRERVEPPPKQPPRRRDEPPRDWLLERLLKVYGPARAPAQAARHQAGSSPPLRPRAAA
jgi:hypothetical protein